MTSDFELQIFLAGILNFGTNSMFALLGYGAGGRLGIGGTDSVCQPMLLESIQHVAIKTVSF